MQTELDDDTLDRVVKIVNDACDTISGDAGLDRKFMLACLQLAYNIEKFSRLLEPLDKKLNDLEFIRTEKEIG